MAVVLTSMPTFSNTATWILSRAFWFLLRAVAASSLSWDYAISLFKKLIMRNCRIALMYWKLEKPLMNNCVESRSSIRSQAGFISPPIKIRAMPEVMPYLGIYIIGHRSARQRRQCCRSGAARRRGRRRDGQWGRSVGARKGWFASAIGRPE